MIWRGKNLDQKQKAREAAFDCTPRQSILLMPGYDCEDLKLAINKGIVKDNTTIFLIERERTVCDQIRKWIDKEWSLPLPPLVYHTNLCDYPMVPIDFAYIDLFGNLSQKDWKWIQSQLVPNLMPGSQLCFTFCCNVWGNVFMQQVIRKLEEKPRYSEILNSLNFYGKTKHLAATYYMLFKYGFLEGYNFDIDFLPYRNTVHKHSMMLMRIRNIYGNLDNRD